MSIIQWYPGHMAKAKREIKENLKLVDLVIELRDARIPFSSKNPMIEEIIGNKPRLILLCKAKMADSNITKEWLNYYKSNGILAIDIDSIENYNLKLVREYSKIALKNEFERRKQKGIINTTIKAIILGIPNVGKSTLINVLAKKKSLKVGDTPGITRSQTWLKVDDDFMLLDTPGVLWPKFEDPFVGIKLSMCGSIKDDIVDLEYVTLEALEVIKNAYPKLLEDRYSITDVSSMDKYQILDSICKTRGCINKGGKLDYTRCCKIVITDIRNLRIGAMSYEKP